MKHNPFSTRKTNPGKIPFLFGKEFFFVFQTDRLNRPSDGLFSQSHADSQEIFRELYDIYENFDYRSQIVGGHGTGKTTFLVDFVRFLLEKGHAVNHFSLHDGQKFLSHEFWERQISLVSQFKIGTPAKPPLAVVDGYEQLAWTQKMRLRRICRKGVAGLLITTHKPAWSMPVLVKTGPTVETLLAVVAYLFRDSPDLEPPDPALCHSLFERHRGNIRNALFELYDHYEMTTDASMERR